MAGDDPLRCSRRARTQLKTSSKYRETVSRKPCHRQPTGLPVSWSKLVPGTHPIHAPWRLVKRRWRCAQPAARRAFEAMGLPAAAFSSDPPGGRARRERGYRASRFLAGYKVRFVQREPTLRVGCHYSTTSGAARAQAVGLVDALPGAIRATGSRRRPGESRGGASADPHPDPLREANRTQARVGRHAPGQVFAYPLTRDNDVFGCDYLSAGVRTIQRWLNRFRTLGRGLVPGHR
jgi:hypothetical protein